MLSSWVVVYYIIIENLLTRIRNHLMISMCWIVPQKAKKSRTSFSVALGDKLVTSAIWSKPIIIIISKSAKTEIDYQTTETLILTPDSIETKDNSEIKLVGIGSILHTF